VKEADKKLQTAKETKLRTKRNDDGETIAIF
jgi:hypothetical protein